MSLQKSDSGPTAVPATASQSAQQSDKQSSTTTASTSAAPPSTQPQNDHPQHRDFYKDHPTSNASLNADHDPLAPDNVYYQESHRRTKLGKGRTFSTVVKPLDRTSDIGPRNVVRRGSHDVWGADIRYKLDVQDTLERLLAQQDPDHNVKITVDDKVDKVFPLPTLNSNGLRYVDIRGTYIISNLLQELTLASRYGREVIVLDYARLSENPVSRLSRLIETMFWRNLTRRIDGSNVAQVARDPKDWTADPHPRIYVPRGAPEQHEYYTRIAHEHPDMRLEVIWLADNPTDEEYVRDLNAAPGLLAIEMERLPDTPEGKPDFRGLEFVVPGGRFNELYGWDSYMETIGLLINGKVQLCENMVRHFIFCIRHYGKILNANRTYYLCRSQPPFLTDMALLVYDRINHRPDSLEFLRQAIIAAIKDYYTTWMSPPRYDAESGLSKYVPGGVGVPPETEATHFIHVLTPYAEKHKMSFEDFVHAYNYGHVFEPELDKYFLHDRAVRESGHDTSYRLEKVAADLATVDLNSLLYKYEKDIGAVISIYFGDELEIPVEWRAPGRPAVENSRTWKQRAQQRHERMHRLMWDEHKGMFFDYHTKDKKTTGYESATTFWAMWAGVATMAQARLMVEKAIPRFEEHGGLASGTEESRGHVGLDRPNRQWDYPFGWAPQQILAWKGLERYGYKNVAQRLAYRWLYMCTKTFADYNGVVVEKYNVTQETSAHKVEAEYGNQGSDFKGVATEGFGWVNASYIYGLELMTKHMKRALGALTKWETFERVTSGGADSLSATGASSPTSPTKVYVAPHVREAAAKGRLRRDALPQSHEFKMGKHDEHPAEHGGESEHHAPAAPKS